MIPTRRAVLSSLTPVLFGAAFFALWQGFVVWRDIKPYLLPTPASVVRNAVDSSHLLRSSAIVSGTNALVGLIAGVVVGTVAAVLTNRLRIVAEVLTPLAIAVNAVPIIVITSFLNNMYSARSQLPRRLMVAVVVFFVVFVNVTRGLRQSDPTQTELMRSYAANDRQMLAKVRLPTALPHLFTAIRIASPLSVITAFVAEYFGGTQDGLGYRITSAMSTSDDALGWAYVGAACVLGLAFFAGSSALEAIAVPWQRRRRE